MKILENKSTIITGANRGIGAATVAVFAEHGANIWACSRKKDLDHEKNLALIAEKNGVEIWPVYFDLCDEKEMAQAVNDIRRQKIPVDVLVNVAGIADESTSFTMTKLEKMKHVMEINFFATTLMTQYVLRLMTRQQKGCVVNVASIAGIDGTPAQYEYAASKAALIGGVRNLAREMARYNIRVNAVAPGMVQTDMGAQISDTLKSEILDKTIMKRMGEPAEIAGAIAFLASDMASFMTGQVIRVDGGM